MPEAAGSGAPPTQGLRQPRASANQGPPPTKGLRQPRASAKGMQARVRSSGVTVRRAAVRAVARPAMGREVTAARACRMSQRQAALAQVNRRLARHRVVRGRSGAGEPSAPPRRAVLCLGMLCLGMPAWGRRDRWMAAGALERLDRAAGLGVEHAPADQFLGEVGW
jgi:hypothetical protein